MSIPAPAGIGALMPALCYADAPAAIAWLERAFGFHAQLVVPGPEGSVMHSELVCGEPPCLIMVYSRRDDPLGRLHRPPRELGGSTQSLYFVVADVDAHHDRAAAAGAEILMPPTDRDHGGRAYTCRDPEGHVWSAGSYDPRPVHAD